LLGANLPSTNIARVSRLPKTLKNIVNFPQKGKLGFYTFYKTPFEFPV